MINCGTTHLMIGLALALATLRPSVASAQFILATNGNAITILKYTGLGSAVTIPGITNGTPVTAISDFAFRGLTNLISVTIPTSVTNVGNWTFDGCANLTNVIGNPTCELHRTLMVWKNVSVHYSKYMSHGYMKAKEKHFPHAGRFVYGGSVVQETMTLLIPVCDRCEENEESLRRSVFTDYAPAE